MFRVFCGKMLNYYVNQRGPYQMLLRLCFVIPLILLSCQKVDSTSFQFSTKLDEVGIAFADWSRSSHMIILINGKSVVHVGANGGGYSPVSWEKDGESLENSGRRNLEAVLLSSSCDPETFIDNLESLNSMTTQVEFSNSFSCLGVIDFVKLPYSSK